MTPPRRVYEADTDFMVDAACRNHPDPNIFFPGSGRNLDADRARVVCASCAVRQDCLDYALKRNIDTGVWGGMAERERRRYKKLLSGQRKLG